MRKLVILVLVLSFILVGCGNKELGFDSYKFDKAVVEFGGEVREYKIKGWRDFADGDQIQITLEDGTVMLTHSENVILLKSVVESSMN